MASPENYNQMLSKLGRCTFLTTLFFLIGLRVLDIIPKIEIDEQLIPPAKDYKELIEWFLSFGAIPLFGAVIAWVMSSLFEVHNKLSKVILLRYMWERYFIVLPMLKRIGISGQLSKKRVKEIMNGLYYPQVKEIDQHYVHIFWRYALQFWVIFEHLLVVLITVVILFYINNELPYNELLWYLLGVFVLALLHWLFVVTKKSKDQADQILEKSIRDFMK